MSVVSQPPILRMAAAALRAARASEGVLLVTRVCLRGRPSAPMT